MSVNIKITEQFRKSELNAQEIELYKNSFVLIPYQVSGIQDYTNRGATTRQVRPEDYETFKRVWTGNDAAQIQWKDSIYYTKNTLPDGKEEAKIIFQLGETLLGVMETNSSDVRIQQDTSLSDYVAQDLKQTYTFRVDRKQFEITDYHQVCLWKIPEVSGSTLFRISNVEKDYIGRELVGYVVVFESINQDLANTGSARQQNIMPSNIGQGYLECKIEDKNWPERIGKEKFETLIDGIDYKKLYDRYITADYSKTQNRPAKKMVVKQLGLGILSSVACIGRPAQAGETFENYKQPRLIFPVNFTDSSTPTLFHTQQETSNYYFGKFAPSLRYWKEWKQNIADTYQAGVSKWEYEGLLEFDISKLRATNPKVNGVYEWNLYGKLVKEQNKVRNEQWTITEQVEKIDTSMVIGCDATYSIGGTKKIHDHMFDNYWTQKYMKVLPITVNSTVAMGLLGDIINAAVGGAFADIVQNFSIWLIGTFSKWIGRTNPLKYQTFRGIICADFIELAENYIQTSSGNKALPLDVFKANGNNDTPASLMFNGNSLLTSFEADLTDRFQASNNVIYSTLNIGQTKLENGNNIFPNGAPLLLNGSEKLVNVDVDGYIIDQIQINGIFNGEYSVEFLDENDEVIWSSIFQSAGMWSNSTRDTWTIRNTSVYGRENVYFDKPFAYPEKLDEPLLAIPTLETIIQQWSIGRVEYASMTNSATYKNNIINILPKTLPTSTEASSVQWISSLLPKTNDNNDKDIFIFEYNDLINDYSKFRFYYPNIKLDYNINWFGRRLYRLGAPVDYDIPDQKQVMWESELLPTLNLNEEQTITLPSYSYEFYGTKIRHYLISFKIMFYEKNNSIYLKVSEIKTEYQNNYNYPIRNYNNRYYFLDIQFPLASTKININEFGNQDNGRFFYGFKGYGTYYASLNTRVQLIPKF